MRYAIPLLISLASIFPALVDAEDGLSADLTKSLKMSTVYVKTEIVSLEFSGSGFVIKQDGDTALIATNQHVIGKPKELQVGGFIPGLRSRDRITLRRMQTALVAAQPKVTVVLHSGEPGEQVLPAEILSASEDPDLAILRVKGVKERLKPFDYQHPPTLNETMTVYMLGFPFGEVLATNKGNPNITVGKGTVSSIRKDAAGKIVKVQIDGALNPGNSGGPVVDNKGNLVGVAVQTIQGSNIGLAIHPLEIVPLLEGSVGPMSLTTQSVAKNKPLVQLSFTVNDPMSKMKDVTVHYVTKALLLNTEQTDLPQVASAEGSQKVTPELKGNVAKAMLPLGPLQEPMQISVQASYVTADGKTHYSRAQLLWLGVSADAAAMSLTTVSNGSVSIITRVSRSPSGGTTTNTTTVKNNSAPPNLKDYVASIAKSEAKNMAKSGGFSAPKTSKKKADSDDELEPEGDGTGDPAPEADEKPKTASSGKKPAAKEAEKDDDSPIKWSNNIKKMADNIPDVELGGKIGGVEFKPDRIEITNSRLVMRQGANFFADAEIDMVLWKQASELAGKKCVVNGRPRQGDPSVTMKIMNKGAKLPNTTILSNFLLVIEFGDYDEDTRTLSGKMYFCCPDKAKSVVAGTFDASVD